MRQHKAGQRHVITDLGKKNNEMLWQEKRLLMYKSLRSFVSCSMISRLQKLGLVTAVQTEMHWRQGRAATPPPVFGHAKAMQWLPPPKSWNSEANGKLEMHPPWNHQFGDDWGKGQLCKGTEDTARGRSQRANVTKRATQILTQTLLRNQLWPGKDKGTEFLS